MVKRVAVFNDLSGLGKCSLTAAIPVISALGIQACPIPTAILSNQTGYDSYYMDDFTEKLDFFTSEWQKLKTGFDGIYTGFLANPKQVDKILHFLEVFKKENTILLVDPVMADNGFTYEIYNSQLHQKMLDLIPFADVITPNLTECCLLAGADYNLLKEIEDNDKFFDFVFRMCEKLLDLGVKTVVVTGIRRNTVHDEEEMYNAICTHSKRSLFKSEFLRGSYSGTGDLFASVICGSLVKGIDIEIAVQTACEFICAAIKDTQKDDISPNDGINFEKYLNMMVKFS